MRHVLVCMLCIFVTDLTAQVLNPAITPDDLTRHVKYLASDELEGRASGTEGNRKAAAYIVDLMRRYGLKPAGTDGGYYQEFDFVSAVKLGPTNALTIQTSTDKGTGKFKPDVDFRPLGFTTNATLTAPLVFAGYGISAPDNNYDDYRDVDVTGKVVMVLRYSPEGNDPHSELYKYTAFRSKARTAREKGAVGLLLVSGSIDDDELVPLAFDQAFASSGIAAVSIKRSAVAPLFESTGRTLDEIEDSIRSSKTPVTLAFPDASITLTTDVEKVMAKTANVAGFLAGSDPKLKDELVVVGAHFDHLGSGGPGSGSLVPDVREIHNGADDNASGTAGLLELMEAFAASADQLKRSIVFLAFSGEEIGTLGSVHYVNNPTFPLEKTIAMVNMDMIGRLDKNVLTVHGTGTSPTWDGLIAKHNADSTFTLKPIPDGFGPSDHGPFYNKGVPVLFFFTGTHSDYHRPSDDWDRINYDGQQKVVQFAYNVIQDINRVVDRPAFARAGTSGTGMGGDSRGFSVTLGIIPDYAETSEGMKIGGIRPNGPAEKAGLKEGDLIVVMAGKKILNIYDYMAMLGELKAGEQVEVEVLRDGSRLKVIATMERRGR